MINNLTNYYNEPLKIIISEKRNKNIQFIRQNYGQLGVDIFENNKTPSILTEKENKKFYKIINNIKKFLGFNIKEDYQKSDSLCSVLFKYLNNKKQVKDSEIKNMFGEKGLELFNKFKILNYVK